MEDVFIQNSIPRYPELSGFNPLAVPPYSCTSEHIRFAMNELVDFLAFVNQQVATMTSGSHLRASGKNIQKVFQRHISVYGIIIQMSRQPDGFGATQFSGMIPVDVD